MRVSDHWAKEYAKLEPRYRQSVRSDLALDLIDARAVIRREHAARVTKCVCEYCESFTSDASVNSTTASVRTSLTGDHEIASGLR